MKNTIQLQSVGKVPAIPSGELKAGDKLMWNFGETTDVLEIVRESEKSIWVKLISCKSGEEFEKRFLKTRLVAVVKREEESLKEHMENFDTVACLNDIEVRDTEAKDSKMKNFKAMVDAYLISTFPYQITPSLLEEYCDRETIAFSCEMLFSDNLVYQITDLHGYHLSVAFRIQNYTVPTYWKLSPRLYKALDEKMPDNEDEVIDRIKDIIKRSEKSVEETPDFFYTRVELYSEHLGKFTFESHPNSTADWYQAMCLFESNNWERLGEVQYALYQSDMEDNETRINFTGVNASAELAACFDEELADEITDYYSSQY